MRVPAPISTSGPMITPGASTTSFAEFGASMNRSFLRLDIKLMLGIEPARDSRKHSAHIGAGKKNCARGNRIARLLADKAPARFGAEESLLVPPSIIEGEMRRTGLLQTGDIKDPCPAVGIGRDLEPHFPTKLRQTEGTAIVVKSRIRHAAILSRRAFRDWSRRSYFRTGAGAPPAGASAGAVAPAAGASAGGVAGRAAVAPGAAGTVPAGTAVNSTLTWGRALSSLCTAIGVTSTSAVERMTEALSNTMLAPRSAIRPFRIGSRATSTTRAALLNPAWISAWRCCDLDLKRLLFGGEILLLLVTDVRREDGKLLLQLPSLGGELPLLGLEFRFGLFGKILRLGQHFLTGR